ncbi:MAG: hypothetical protein SRB2_04641 [Desulfobacteraceae bacterium Eth-SRB2]|nr:MAG: hypothetical protein SRB2_04641 [Desulfobacteraceae bacterium Eth-SRB2]
MRTVSSNVASLMQFQDSAIGCASDSFESTIKAKISAANSPLVPVCYVCLLPSRRFTEIFEDRAAQPEDNENRLQRDLIDKYYRLKGAGRDPKHQLLHCS